MDWIEYWKAMIPAFVAAIPVLILAFQLRQQNRLERKKIEVEYLRRALEVLELPVKSLHELQSSSSYVALRRKNGVPLNLEEEIAVPTRRFVEALERHNNALTVAQIFARESGASELNETLGAAVDAAEKLRTAAAAAATAGIRGELVNVPVAAEAPEDVKNAAFARVDATRALVARIHKLYG